MKIINSDYNSESGKSFVEIQTKLGRFAGYAQVHPEDTNFKSRFAGCDYAMMRAMTKYYKIKLRNEKQRLIGMQYLVSHVSIENKKPLYHQINLQKNKIEELKNVINSTESVIKDASEKRIAMVSKTRFINALKTQNEQKDKK